MGFWAEVKELRVATMRNIKAGQDGQSAHINALAEVYGNKSIVTPKQPAGPDQASEADKESAPLGAEPSIIIPRGLVQQSIERDETSTLMVDDETEPEDVVPSKNSKAIVLGILGAFAIVVVVVLGQIAQTEQTKPDQAGQTKFPTSEPILVSKEAKDSAEADLINKAKGNAWGTAMDAVKRQMNDPSSFEFVDVGIMPGKTDAGAPAWFVALTYRGTNSFGGVVTQQTLVTVDESGNRVVSLVNVQ